MKSAPQFQSAAIDHLGVVGRDIAIMIDAYVRLGFSPTEPVPLTISHPGSNGAKAFTF